MRDTEVCVLGAGPAGATIARRLAQLGHAVCLLEAAPFPRRRIGELLPPSILPLFETLGLRAVMETAGFLRPAATLLAWSSAGVSRKTTSGAPGFQVDRGRFDALLLDAARQSGVQVMQPVTAARPQRDPHQGWVIRLHTDGAAVPSLHARVLVDATGRRGLGPHQRTRTTAPTLALYGYWYGVPGPGAEARVEAGPDAWYWGAALPDGSLNAAVFLDTAAGAGLGRARLEALYRTHLAQSCLLRSCLVGRLDGGLQVCDATGFLEAQPIGQDFVRVGEAAYAVDPLSSQGVHLAMLSALQGSIALHTILTVPAQAEAACEFYRTQQAATVARSQRTAAQLYALADRWAAAPFWQRRATAPAAATPPEATTPMVRPLPPQQGLRLADTLQVVETPAIVGDLIARVPALLHPSLPQPVAFLGPTALAPLLRDIVPGRTAEAVLQRWTQRLPWRDGQRVLHWLWQMGLVMPIAEQLKEICPCPLTQP